MYHCRCRAYHRGRGIGIIIKKCNNKISQNNIDLTEYKLWNFYFFKSYKHHKLRNIYITFLIYFLTSYLLTLLTFTAYNKSMLSEFNIRLYHNNSKSIEFINILYVLKQYILIYKHITFPTD